MTLFLNQCWHFCCSYNDNVTSSSSFMCCPRCATMEILKSVIIILSVFILILFSKYLKISKNKGRISEAHLSVGGSQLSFQPTQSCFENWKDVHVFETWPVASRPNSWGAQIPPFSRGKKKCNLNWEPKLFCFLLYFHTDPEKRWCHRMLQSKRFF